MELEDLRPLEERLPRRLTTATCRRLRAVVSL